MSEPLPRPVRDFLDVEIFSIPQLEVLLLVHTIAEPQTVDQVAQDFYLPASVLRPWLDSLVVRGLLSSTDGRYCALPEDDPKHRVVSEIAACYAKRRVSMARHVYSSNEDPVRRFADAFRLRKDKKP